MAVLTVYIPPVFGSGMGFISHQTSTLFRIVSGTVTLDYYGTDLTYQGSFMSGGTVTGTALFDSSNGGLQYQVTGLNHGASETDQLSRVFDTGLAAFFFSGNDTIQSASAQGTILRGWAGNDYVVGNSGNDVLSGGEGVDTLAGGLGNDTYHYDFLDFLIETAGSGSDTVILDNASGDFILPEHFENLELSISNAVRGIGNAAANEIRGGSASSNLQGLDGNDTLHSGSAGSGPAEYLDGGNGNDSLYGFSNDTLDGGAGIDTMTGGGFFVVDHLSDVISSFNSYGIVLNVNGYGFDETLVESIVLGNVVNSVIGNSRDNFIAGNNGNNTISGAVGNDTLDGKGGADSLLGGEGDDAYIAYDHSDVIVELTGQGQDVIYSSIDFSLPVNVEKLVLTGNSNINAVGGSSRETLIGNAGANILNGGPGIDTLVGGDGGDTYHIDARHPDSTLQIFGQAGEIVTQGNNFSYNLRAQDTIFSNLIRASVGDYNFDGQIDLVRFSTDIWSLEFSATLIGNLALGTYSNAYSNPPFSYEGYPSLNIYRGWIGQALYGSFVIHEFDLVTSPSGWTLTRFSASFEQRVGSEGAPALIGSITYDYLSGAIDTISEGFSGVGMDAVITHTSMTIPDNIEKLQLAGISDLEAKGNEADNIISGNSANNVLDGASGADIIAGGLGNDTYVVGHSGDQVMELGNSGTDLVRSAITYSLMQAWHVENLTLFWSDAINGTGNWLDNVINGNDAANRIDGNRGNDTIDGGGGTDTLIGGLGDDTLVWDSGDASVQGGAGIDTLLINGSGVTLNLIGISDNRITDVEVINIVGSGNNTLTLGLADVLAISSSTDQLRVDGDAGDALNLQGSWSNTGSAGGYVTYGQGLAVLKVDADITVGFV